MEVSSEIRWGIIGCGDVTEVKSGPAFNRVPGSSLVAVMRRTPGLARDYADRHQVSKWYEDADKLIHDPDVNAVYVATPPSTHAEYAIRSMKAGKPVYVEKPMAARYEECLEMEKISRETGVPLWIAYYRPFMPYFRKVKELLDAGSIGKIRHISVRLFTVARAGDNMPDALPWRVIPEISGGGYFHDLASHQLNLLTHFFGIPVYLHGIALRKNNTYQPEDTVMAEINYPGNVRCDCSWCFSSCPEEETDLIEIMGEKGKLTFSSFRFSPVELITETGLSIFDIKKDATVQFHLIHEIVDQLLGRSKNTVRLDYALDTSRQMEVILKYK